MSITGCTVGETFCVCLYCFVCSHTHSCSRCVQIREVVVFVCVLATLSGYFLGHCGRNVCLCYSGMNPQAAKNGTGAHAEGLRQFDWFEAQVSS